MAMLDWWAGTEAHGPATGAARAVRTGLEWNRDGLAVAVGNADATTAPLSWRAGGSRTAGVVEVVRGRPRGIPQYRPRGG